MAGAINASNLELGPCNLYRAEKVRATLTTVMTGSDNDLVFRARVPGVAGNSINIVLVDPPGNNVALSIAVVTTTITVTLATDGTSTITTTAAQLRDAINADFAAFSLVYAVLAAAGAGAGVVTALSSTPLAGGSDTTTEVFLGALGEETSFNVTTEAAPLTAAQTGNLPQSKVIIGGSAQIVAPLKEMTLANFERAFGNAILIEGVGGLARLEFLARVGENLRTSRGARYLLKKIVGGVESTLTKDILTVPEASPVDAQVSLSFSPTEQRVLAMTVECWPDGRGMLAYFGDTTL